MKLLKKENHWMLVWVLGSSLAVLLSFTLGYLTVFAMMALVPITRTIALGMHRGSSQSAWWLVPGIVVLPLTFFAVDLLHLEPGSTSVLLIGLLVYLVAGEYLLSRIFKQKISGLYLISSVVGAAVVVGIFYLATGLVPRSPGWTVNLGFFVVLALVHSTFSAYGVHLGYGRKAGEAV